MQTTTLRDLRAGDRIHSIGAVSHAHKPLVVESALGPINSGNVLGLRCGTLAGGIEMVLYPSQCDGQVIRYERD